MLYGTDVDSLFPDFTSAIKNHDRISASCKANEHAVLYRAGAIADIVPVNLPNILAHSLLDHFRRVVLADGP
eukprot:742747-Pyramimonas_sp.AAC.1